jgi:hypothetical protein
LACRCRNLKQRACKIIFAWDIAEYPDNVQFITRSSRPAKDNRTYIAENCQKALGAGHRSALVNATHRRTNHNVVVNNHKRHRSKFGKLVRQFAYLPFAFTELFDSQKTSDLDSTTKISTPRFGARPAMRLNSQATATTA